MTAIPATLPPVRAALSIRESARYIGVGVTKFYNLIAAGEIAPPRKIGSRSVMLIADLDAFLSRLPAAGKPGTAADAGGGDEWS